tara:strand:+ start:1858 stop:2076 length:219 start_codon:yes stop_codon:yes gene_type:complete
MSKIKDKLAELIDQNNTRVKQVDEMGMQIEQLKTNIAALKEEHDFTRGKIAALQELEEADNEKAATTKTKKG